MQQSITFKIMPFQQKLNVLLMEDQLQDYVNSNIYNNIMQPPTYEEWISTLRCLPNDKATGLSKISNKKMSHLGSNL